MRRKTVPVKNGADAMIAAGREGLTEVTKEVNNAGDGSTACYHMWSICDAEAYLLIQT